MKFKVLRGKVKIFNRQDKLSAINVKFRKAYKFFLEWLYPNRCAFCKEILQEPEVDCCHLCYNNITVITKGFCSRCGKVHMDTSNLCFDCKHYDHYYLQGRGMLNYDKSVKAGLFGLKFFKQTWVGAKFGKMLYEFYREEELWQVDVIIPVPLHYTRFLERGYNQAQIISEEFAKKSGVLHLTKCLKRHKVTKPQKELHEDERRKNMFLAFSVSDKKAALIRGKKILLIDDIYTTGSTIDACAKALMDQGAKEVYFLTIAIGSGL